LGEEYVNRLEVCGILDATILILRLSVVSAGIPTRMGSLLFSDFS